MSRVEDFLSRRKQRGGPLPEIQVSAVETATTRAEIPAFVAHWKGRVDRVRIYPEHSQGGVFGALPSTVGDFGPRRPCKKPLTDLVVTCDGQAALCNQDWERKTPLGDLNRQTIAEVWAGEALEQVRRLHREGREEEDPSCRGCAHWAQYYVEGGILGKLIPGSPPWQDITKRY